MFAYYSDTFVLPLPRGHRFPMAKYERLRLAIAEDPELTELVRLEIPPGATDEELLLVHQSSYLDSLIQGTLDPKIERRIGFPYSPGMLERSRRSVGATISAARASLREGAAVNLAGGTHHSFADRGEGFCVFNDTAVAIRVLQREGRIRKALVIDTDVHQGNGTADIFAKDDSVFTLSIHGAKNFPFKKTESDLDIALADGCQDEEYLEILDNSLPRLPVSDADLVIFQTGADPYAEDKLGRLSLSKEGLRQRDRMVLDWCHQNKLPVAVTMGGGYCPDISQIVDIHLNTIRETSIHYSRQLANRP